MLPILAAIERGDVKEVGRLLAQIPQEDLEDTINRGDYRKRTALHFAVEHGLYGVVEMLIGCHGINLAAKDCDGFSPLHIATELGHDKIVARLLMERLELVDETAGREEDLTCLHLAVSGGHVLVVMQLLGARPELIHVTTRQNRLREHQKSILQIAVEHEQKDIIAMLLENCESGHMFYSAMKAGYDHIANQLLDQSPQFIDRACDLGVSYGRDTIVARALDAKPELIDTEDAYGRTLLHSAANHGHEKVCAVLLSRKPELINARDRDYRTPFDTTQRMSAAQLLSCAFVHGPHAVTPFTCWSLMPDIRARPDWEETVRVILAHKPELTKSAHYLDGDTLLHFVFWLKRKNNDGFNEELMTQVLQMNPDALRMTNDSKQTPLDLAFKFNNKFAIELAQWKLSLDEIVQVFDRKRRGLPQSLFDKLYELVVASLNKDVAMIVYEYLGRWSHKHNGPVMAQLSRRQIREDLKSKAPQTNKKGG